jgi:hypothetical protein
MSFRTDRIATVAIEPRVAGASKKGFGEVKRVALKHAERVHELSSEHVLVETFTVEELEQSENLLVFWSYLARDVTSSVHWPSVPLMLTLEVDGAAKYSTMLDPAKTQPIGGLNKGTRGSVVYTRLEEGAIVATESDNKVLSLLAFVVPHDQFLEM